MCIAQMLTLASAVWCGLATPLPTYEYIPNHLRCNSFNSDMVKYTYDMRVQCSLWLPNGRAAQ